MKKIEFKLRNLELVKGCPTDINGNNLEDDDYNNDGLVDQDDQDYYDGYMDGYMDGLVDDFNDGNNCEENGVYSAGYLDGLFDGEGDVNNSINPGPDIDGEDFNAPPASCPAY